MAGKTFLGIDWGAGPAQTVVTLAKRRDDGTLEIRTIPQDSDPESMALFNRMTAEPYEMFTDEQRRFIEGLFDKPGGRPPG